MAKEDDDAWQAIVDNYGDRPELDEPEPAPPTRRPHLDEDDRYPDPTSDQAGWDDPYVDADWESDRFVPPPPPPIPTTTVDRQAAWLGVLGSPLVLLVCLIFRIPLPVILGYALVGAFVGGFLYLVFTMTREPRDPDDDGAVL